MRPVHIISILAAIAIIALFYFGGNIVPPKKAGEQQTAATEPHAVAPASFDSVLHAAKTNLPEHAREEVVSVETALAGAADSGKMAVYFDSLGKIWQEHRQPDIAAFYYLEAGKLENSEKKLTFAAQLLLELARRAHSAEMQAWNGQKAIEGFRKVLEINPDNDTIKVLLAESLIGTGSTMDGVLLLRDVTTSDPDNVPANLILGQQGIVSGQLDKAMDRFETVLKAEPENVAALLGLAEVQKNKGNKEKAIELLEQAKKVMKNPDFDKDVDQYISTFK